MKVVGKNAGARRRRTALSYRCDDCRGYVYGVIFMEDMVREIRQDGQGQGEDTDTDLTGVI